MGIPQLVIGTVVLAALTGLPNVLASVRLARRGRGSALVSESFNSNTLNLLIGVTLPALIAGLAAPAGSTLLTVWWLAGITAVTSQVSDDHHRIAQNGTATASVLGFPGAISDPVSARVTMQTHLLGRPRKDLCRGATSSGLYRNTMVRQGMQLSPC